MKNNKLTLVSGQTFEMSEGWDLAYDVLLSGNKISYIPAGFTAVIAGLLYFLDLSNNEITSIHPQAGLDAFDHIDLSNNRLTCLPEGFFFSTYYYDLSGNQLSTIHKDHFATPSYDSPTIVLTSNPMQCIASCWFKHYDDLGGAYAEGVSCVDGVNWDYWDGLDASGDCVIPPFPACPLPSPIPTPPSQCPNDCQGRRAALFKLINENIM